MMPATEQTMDPSALEDLEVRLLLQALGQVYGHDFTDYAESSLKRRLRHWLAGSSYATFSHAQAAVLRDRAVFDSLLQGITVNFTEMFRDPPFFLALKEKVIPFLQTYPFVNIWHAGCSTGEEAYSMAILMHEAGMHGRYRLYATDINEAVLERAKAGIYPLKAMQGFTRNYQRGGGNAEFANYYTARYDGAIFSAALRENLVFAPHNLVTDSGIGAMHMVLCRNVMIYFKPVLKERCLGLFDASLAPGGFLCLGMKERMDGRALGGAYERFAANLSIYRKRYG